MTQITWVKAGVLGFGDIDACGLAAREDWAVVHACKHPCHRECVGYKNTLDKTHLHYLAAERNGGLYLNLIDPPVPLFQMRSFAYFFDFIDRNLDEKPIVIHCNRGESRAPSLTLLVLAKRMGMLPGESYKDARAAFEAEFPYKPSEGIRLFLERHWDELGALAPESVPVL